MAYLLHQLIEESADRSPDSQAIRFRDASLSYAGLQARAAQLANALIEDGLSPGERVGILHTKGIESAVALYGIMMAGGVYVPLDPFAPAGRTAFVMRDCGISRLASDAGRVATLQAVAADGVEIESVFGLENAGELPMRGVSAEAIAGFADSAPRISATEQDLCYILYTSGSTGTPKGIMHSHRSALSWADVTAHTHGLRGDDVLTNYAPLHFDLSTLDYFGGARAGATTVIIPEAHTKFAASLAGLIEEEGITVFYTVPMALIQLGEAGILEGRDLSRLRLVLFGGEPMPVKHLRAIMDRLPAAEFVNVYGPTETNGCTYFPVSEVPDAGIDGLPIGRPYPNVEVLIVDSDDQLVPAGAEGELLVRAPTMMRGYWGREDLNAEAFYYRTPYGGQPDVFHRTGDLVALGKEGAIRFLGRKDRQIKARGYRVELDEVEAVLMTHTQVHEAAVYALPDATGTLEIRAEAILEVGSDGVTSADLVQHVKASLPPYAVPRSIEIRTEFPRTSSGKIDRMAMQAESSDRLSAVGGG